MANQRDTESDVLFNLGTAIVRAQIAVAKAAADKEKRNAE